MASGPFDDILTLQFVASTGATLAASYAFSDVSDGALITPATTTWAQAVIILVGREYELRHTSPHAADGIHVLSTWVRRNRGRAFDSN